MMKTTSVTAGGRTSYSADFKERAVRLVEQTEENYKTRYEAIQSVVAELGMQSPATLQKWVYAAKLPSRSEVIPAAHCRPRPERRNTLRVTPAAEATLDRIIGNLRRIRLDSGLLQEQVVTMSGLPVRARAISEWEVRTVEPTWEHLLQWVDGLGCRFVLVTEDGQLACPELKQRAGESWITFQRRRLATPLRDRRVISKMTDEKLGRSIGVTRDSISRWELLKSPPRPISKIVWAQALGRNLALQRVDRRIIHQMPRSN